MVDCADLHTWDDWILFLHVVKTSKPANQSRYRSIIDKYTEQLTIHGLSMVFHGRPMERILWGICLIVASILAYLISKNFVNAFTNNETTLSKVSFSKPVGLTYALILALKSVASK